jgi:RNA polymerase sigma-70 factor (ECF subfamily)
VDPDRTFVTQAAAGSREAFDELVRRYRRPVYSLVRALTGGDDDAEDLVQDVFVRAFRAVHRFRGDSAFKSWLYRIAVNVVHTHLQRRRTRDAFAGPRTIDAASSDVADGDNLEEAMVRRQAIERALASLPEQLRVLVVLRDVQGLKYDEIAKIVKSPRGTVESRLFRARQQLRPMLEPLVVIRSSVADTAGAESDAAESELACEASSRGGKKEPYHRDDV